MSLDFPKSSARKILERIIPLRVIGARDLSLDFYHKGTTPKRSAQKILERIIPPPSGGRDLVTQAESECNEARSVSGTIPEP